MTDHPANQDNSSTPKAILVVDDHELVRNLVVGMLINEGFDVKSAATGQEAIELVRTDHSIQCVLQDLSMPNMRGEEIIAEVSRIRPQLPVLVYSADEEAAVAHRLQPLGVAGYLQKPFDPEELITRLHALTQSDPA